MPAPDKLPELPDQAKPPTDSPSQAVPLDVREIIPELWIVVDADRYIRLATPQEIEQSRTDLFEKKLLKKNRPQH